MADTPPRRQRQRQAATAAATDGKGERATTQARAGSLERRLEEFVVKFALPFKAMGDDYCASVIVTGAPDLAKAWNDLAQESPAVRNVLNNMMKGGAWGGVIISTLAIAIPIAGHHDLIPERFNWVTLAGGKPPPESTATENGTGSSAPPIPRTPAPTGRVATAGSAD